MKACFTFHKHNTIFAPVLYRMCSLTFGSTLCIRYNTVAHIIFYPCNCEHVFVTALRTLKFSGLWRKASLSNCINCVQKRLDPSSLHYKPCMVKSEDLSNQGFSDISQTFASTRHRHLSTVYKTITSRVINAVPVAHGQTRPASVRRNGPVLLVVCIY